MLLPGLLAPFPRGMGAVLILLRPSSEAFLILYPPHRKQANCPSLCASSDHRFIVGTLRARRTIVCFFPIPPPSLSSASEDCRSRLGRRRRSWLPPPCFERSRQGPYRSDPGRCYRSHCNDLLRVLAAAISPLSGGKMGIDCPDDFWYKNSKSVVESNGLLWEVAPQWGDLSYPEASVPRRIANLPKNGYYWIL